MTAILDRLATVEGDFGSAVGVLDKLQILRDGGALGLQLHELPDGWFDPGGVVDELARLAGYDESGHVVVGRCNAWGMTLGGFLDSILPHQWAVN